MSFFSSIGQYVADMADSVAGLALSPRRGPPPRHRSADESAQQSSSNIAAMRGFPRVVPCEGAGANMPLPSSSPLLGGPIGYQGRRRTLECLAPAPLPARSRGGSLRVARANAQAAQAAQAAQTPPEKPSLAFCRRRLSWPEVDNSVNSGVQDTDGSYFESFTALSWRAEERRMAALRDAEAAAERPPPPSTALGLPRVPAALPQREHDQLYTEVLYTISNAVGAPAPSGRYAHYKEELYETARVAFCMPPDAHRRAMQAAGSERPPVIVLAVHVIEADGLEAKDANGFSDPYCMLGIQPTSLPTSPRSLESGGGSTNSSEEGSSCGGTGGGGGGGRKHSGFRLSFKRRDRDGRHGQQRDSVGRLPARFIRATSVRPHTLSPRWEETFKFDIDDVSSDVLHLDIWDHDDESSVLDAVSRLNEVRGVRGLGRFFKQVCQSARQGSQDDFLGCVNIPLRDIPSTGLESWFRLEARSQRSSVQGRIRLRLTLSAREAGRAGPDDDNWQQVRQHERLFCVLLSHEAASWCSEEEALHELSGPAQTLMHQHAVQGDLAPLQVALARWVAAVKVYADITIEPKYMYKLLTDVERVWTSSSTVTASHEEECWLAESFGDFIERCMQQLRLHRQLYPALHHLSLINLEYLLRCLSLLSQMKAFWKCCPFNKEIRGEIVSALRKGTAEWYDSLVPEETGACDEFVAITTVLQVDLQQGLTYYHQLFETTNNIPYFTVVFMQIDKMLSEDVKCCVQSWVDEGWCGVAEEEEANNEGSGRTIPFELLVSLKELISLGLAQRLGGEDGRTGAGPQLQLLQAQSWFEPLVERWLTVTNSMALQRIRSAVQLDRIVEGEHIVKHSTSSVDTAACLYRMRSVWKAVGGGCATRLVEVACGAALHYADLVHNALAETGYYDNNGSQKTVEEICVIVNNLEYVRRSLAEYEDDLSMPEGSAGRGGGTVAVETLLRGSLSTLEQRAARALAPLASRSRPHLKKAVFHLAWSPDTLPTPQAITPLLEYLDTHLSALNAWLLGRNFSRALTQCWAGALHELAAHVDCVNAAAGGPEGDGDKPRVFHDRLREALDYLVDFFHADGKGLSLPELHSEAYCRISQRLQYHRAPTDRLLELWLAHRLQAQAAATLPSPYGSIFVRIYFNHDSLCIEILSARDVIPLDPNGFSDPFVIVELLPRRVFPRCTEQVTNVQKKTLNPVWDECFEYGVSLEQCRAEGAALALTVLDRDVLTADDFAGEAFVSLARVPGVAEPPPPPPPPHLPDPLRPLELPLMQLHDRQHPILQILESRSNDKVAIEFVKKQKMRFATQ